MAWFDKLLERKTAKSPGTSAQTLSRVSGGTKPSQIYGQSMVSGWDNDKAVTDGYERVLWVFRCVDAIAQAQARLPMYVMEGGDEDQKIINDEELNHVLNQIANSYEKARDFRYRLSCHLLLSRTGAMVEVVRSKSGGIAELNLLPISTMPIPWKREDGGKARLVKEFRVRNTDYQDDRLPPFDPDGKEINSVIWVRQRHHPTDLFAQMTPLHACSLAADTDFYARVFNRSFLMNDGRPGMLIGLRGRMNRDDAEEIKRYFSGGIMGAGQTRVIEIDDIQVADMSGSPRDAQWLESLTKSKEDILAAFGVSETFLGMAAGRTFDNADAENEITWQTTIVDHCDAVGSGLEALTGSVDDKKYLGFDYTKVDVLQRQKRMRHEKKAAEYAAGLCTIDDYLEYIGEKPWDVVGTRILFHPLLGLKIAKNPEDQAEADKLGTPPAPEGGVDENGNPLPPGQEQGALPPGDDGNRFSQQESYSYEENDTSGFGFDEDMPTSFGYTPGRKALPHGVSEAGTASNRTQLAARAVRIAGKSSPFRAPEAKAIGSVQQTRPAIDITSGSLRSLESKGQKQPHPYSAARTQAEAEIAATLAVWSRRQEKTVVAKIGGPAVLKHTRHDPNQKSDGGNIGADGPHIEYKKIPVGKILDAGKWAQDLRDDMEVILKKHAEAQANRVAEDLRKKGLVQATVGAALDTLVGGSLERKMLIDTQVEAMTEMIAASAERQSDRVADLIERLDNDGKSLAEIKAEVTNLIGTRGTWFKGLSIQATTALLEGVQADVLSEVQTKVLRVWWTQDDERVRPSHWLAEGDEAPAGQPFQVGESYLMYPGDPSGPVHETVNCRCWTSWEVAKP